MEFPWRKTRTWRISAECAIREMKEELAVEITELEEIFTGPLVLIQSFGKDIFILLNKSKEKLP